MQVVRHAPDCRRWPWQQEPGRRRPPAARRGRRAGTRSYDQRRDAARPTDRPRGRLLAADPLLAAVPSTAQARVPSAAIHVAASTATTPPPTITSSSGTSTTPVASREDIRAEIFNDKINAAADAYLAELRADAMVRQP